MERGNWHGTGDLPCTVWIRLYTNLVVSMPGAHGCPNAAPGLYDDEQLAELAPWSEKLQSIKIACEL